MHKDKHLPAWDFRLQILCASDLIYLYSASVTPLQGHASVHPSADVMRKFNNNSSVVHSAVILFFLVHSSESFLAGNHCHFFIKGTSDFLLLLHLSLKSCPSS